MSNVLKNIEVRYKKWEIGIFDHDYYKETHTIFPRALCNGQNQLLHMPNPEKAESIG